MFTKEEAEAINRHFYKTFVEPSAEEVVNILEDIMETFSDEEDWRRALRYAIACVKEKG